MDKKFQRILEQIAKEHGSTPEEVYREMQIAIDAGFDNPDPKVQETWKGIPFKGDRPTPEELVMALTKMIKQSKG